VCASPTCALPTEGQTLAAVTHGGVIRAALAEALGLPAERIFALDVGYSSVSAIDSFGADTLVRLVNGTGADMPPVPSCRRRNLPAWRLTTAAGPST
jgi:broad specificity phosphatase PhoE